VSAPSIQNATYDGGVDSVWHPATSDTEDTAMTIWFHSTILATTILAGLAVGVASAAIDGDADEVMAAKGDRLRTATRGAPANVTFERRQPGVSVLIREFMDPNRLQPN